MSSICRFMPSKNGGDLKAFNFVYETEIGKLKQPFFRTVFVLHLVTRGTAVLKACSKSYPLRRGTVFIAFPAWLFEIEPSPDFEYLYISFMGAAAPGLLSSRGIDLSSPVFDGHEDLIGFWNDSIGKVTPQNANTLTESVLLYTLSFVGNGDGRTSRGSDLFDRLIDFADRHYRDPGLSLKQLSAQFSYTEKYLSSLFKKHTGVGFSSYINRLRIQYARELISQGSSSVSEISACCGFENPLYFSKVFKSKTGLSPTEYIRTAKRG